MLVFTLIALLAGALPERQAPVVSVAVHGPVECLPLTPGIKTSLLVTISNPSTLPLSIGRISIVRERFYRLSQDDTLAVIHTSNAPDVTYGLSDLLKGMHEETLSPDKNMTLSFDHSIYLVEDDVIQDGENRQVLVSFDITNLRKDGQASEYWSELTRISVPKDCRLR